jgi:hypothetical protein
MAASADAGARFAGFEARLALARVCFRQRQRDIYGRKAILPPRSHYLKVSSRHPRLSEPEQLGICRFTSVDLPQSTADTDSVESVGSASSLIMAASSSIL